VPTNNGFRLHNRQRIANITKQSKQTNEYQSVDHAEGEFLWSGPPQNVDLLPQRPNLCLKRCSRADQIDDDPTKKPTNIPVIVGNSIRLASGVELADALG
jgi:hypothetical protein